MPPLAAADRFSMPVLYDFRSHGQAMRLVAGSQYGAWEASHDLKGQRTCNYKYSAEIDASVVVAELGESKVRSKQQIASVHYKKRPSRSDSVITWEASTVCITDSSNWR